MSHDEKLKKAKEFLGSKHCLSRDFKLESLAHGLLEKWKASQPKRTPASNEPAYQPTILDNWKAGHVLKRAA